MIMKTKHYILIAVALLVIAILAIPYYFYKKKYAIIEDPYKNGTIQTCMPLKGEYIDYNDPFFTYMIMWWKIKILKPKYWSIQLRSYDTNRALK